MEKVIGIGGIFFRSREPKALARWYEQHLGVSTVPETYDEPAWTTAAGPTVFAPFDENSDYFGRAEQEWMLNFRVADLRAMVEQLRDAGIAVEMDQEVYPNGRFARLSDPEGNPIELWQPAGDEAGK
jgi:glyoxylase I family protein